MTDPSDTRYKDHARRENACHDQGVMKRAALIMENFPICLKFPVKSPFFRGKYLTKKKGAYIYNIVS